MTTRSNPASRQHDPLAARLLAEQRANGIEGPISRRQAVVKLTGYLTVLAALVVFGLVYSSGTEAVKHLDEGQCFEAPTEWRPSRVTLVDCTEPHGGQVLAVVGGLSDDADLACQLVWLGVEDQAAHLLPPDAELRVWTQIIRHRCIAISPSNSLVSSLNG